MAVGAIIIKVEQQGAKKAGDELKGLTGRVKEVTSAQDDLAAATRKAQKSVTEQSGAMKDFAVSSFKGVGSALEGVNKAYKLVNEGIDEYVKVNQAMAGVSRLGTDRLQQLRTATKGTVSDFDLASQATKKFGQDIKANSEEWDKFKKGLADAAPTDANVANAMRLRSAWKNALEGMKSDLALWVNSFINDWNLISDHLDNSDNWQTFKRYGFGSGGPGLGLQAAAAVMTSSASTETAKYRAGKKADEAAAQAARDEADMLSRGRQRFNPDDVRNLSNAVSAQAANTARDYATFGGKDQRKKRSGGGGGSSGGPGFFSSFGGAFGGGAGSNAAMGLSGILGGGYGAIGGSVDAAAASQGAAVGGGIGGALGSFSSALSGGIGSAMGALGGPGGEAVKKGQEIEALAAQFEDFRSRAVDGLTESVATGIAAVLDGTDSLAGAFGKMLKARATAMRNEALLEAAKHGAAAVGSLAYGDVRGAATHGLAAAKWVGVAALAHVAGLAGGAMASGGGTASAGGGGGMGAAVGAGLAARGSNDNGSSPVNITINYGGMLPPTKQQSQELGDAVGTAIRDAQRAGRRGSYSTVAWERG